LLSVESVVPQSKIGTTGTLLYVTVISCLWDTAEDAGPPCHMVSLDYVEMAHSVLRLRYSYRSYTRSGRVRAARLRNLRAWRVLAYVLCL
jgi:hypothetical protein